MTAPDGDDSGRRSPFAGPDDGTCGRSFRSGSGRYFDCGRSTGHDGGHSAFSDRPAPTPAAAAAEGTDGLREALADALEAMLTAATGIATRGYWLRRSDRLLAGPLADLIRERDEAQRSARLAWDVHAEHVDRMNVLVLQAQAERDEARRVLADLVEAVSRGDAVLAPTYRRAREYLTAVAGQHHAEEGAGQ